MLFLGSFWLSISVILGAIQSYGLTHGPRYPWLITTIYVLYWMYATCSLANTIAQFYILIASTKIQRPVQFSPAFFLIGYSAMLTGTIASLIAPTQPAHRAEMLIISGLTFKGYGWIISLICIVYFIRNLIDNGLPPPSLRPGLFIPVGSVAYTIITFIGLARAIPQHPETGYFAAHPDAREILNVMALWVSVFMWLFSFFLFAVAVLANVGGARKMGFSLVWWAFIFPNVGFTLGTGMIGVELGSEAIEWFASILTVLLLAIWIVALVGCVRAVWKGQIVWPGKDEDKNV